VVTTWKFREKIHRKRGKKNNVCLRELPELAISGNLTLTFEVEFLVSPNIQKITKIKKPQKIKNSCRWHMGETLLNLDYLTGRQPELMKSLHSGRFYKPLYGAT